MGEREGCAEDVRDAIYALIASADVRMRSRICRGGNMREHAGSGGYRREHAKLYGDKFAYAGPKLGYVREATGTARLRTGT